MVEVPSGAAVDTQQSQGSDVHAIRYEKDIHTEMLIGDIKVNFQIDCGASMNVNNPSKPRPRSRNPADYEMFSNVEWIPSKAYRNRT